MTSLLLFTAPLLLLIVVGILIRARGNPETSGRRYFLFLVWSSLGSLSLILLSWIVRFPWLDFAIVLFPIIPGLIVLTFLHWGEWDILSRRKKGSILSVVGILLTVTIGQLVLVSTRDDALQLEPIFFGMALLSISGFMLIAWKWGKRYPLVLFLMTVIYLTFFLAFDLAGMSLPSETMSGWMNALGALAYLAIPGMAIPVMGKLTAEMLATSSTVDEARPAALGRISGRLMLSLILFGYLLYTYRWLSLWDGIDDGIRWFFMVLVAVMAAISAALMITMTATGGRRWTGLIFALLVIGPIYLAGMTSFGSGNGISNYTITEGRAARIERAIESHHDETGRYPSSLQELIPSQMWRVALPMIMPGQGWCYQSGPDYYRLGAVFREHWSSPYLSVRVYASEGHIPDGSWECDEKLAEAISNSGILDTSPTPVPLPTSAASVQKVIIEPVMEAESLALAGWSPDGVYLAFEQNELIMTDMEQMNVELHFLDARTGEVCQPSESKRTVANSYRLSEHSAWLPDGRLLYLTDDGKALAFSPCVAGVEDLTGQIPVRFPQIMSSDQESGRILVKNEEAYWLLNGNTLDLRKIDGVPTESYRPMYAWSSEGERLAMSIMSGSGVEDDAYLYIVDWASGEVKHTIPLEDASDEHLPLVQWLTHDELLVHGKTLTVMDFRSDPPGMTDVLKDIFLLDISYPTDVSSTDVVSAHGDSGYFIGVQLNHTHNRDAYVYSSKMGQVDVFHHDLSTLIFFPDGQWMRLLKWDDPPSTRDEYDLVWLDGSHENTPLRVDGHTPRVQYQMLPGYLPDSSQLFFSSSQGISLVSIPDGKIIGFWHLSSNADYFSVTVSPNGDALIVESSEDGLYYIPNLSR